MTRYPVLLSSLCALCGESLADPLPGTTPLESKDDLAMTMVAGIDRYLTRELAASPEKRKAHWKPDFTSAAAYAKSVEPNRQRLRQILGMIDERKPVTDIEYVGGPKTPSLVAETDLYRVHAIRWPVFDGVDGEGLLLEPKGKVLAQIVALPDADASPEMLVGLVPGVPKELQIARRLAENGCRVVVPVLIDRKDDWSGSPKFNRWTNQPHREFVYRMAYEMGRHPIGYEVHKVLAAVDWFTKEKGHPPVGVAGYGEGAVIAGMAAAVDTRIGGVASLGAFGLNLDAWQGPLDHNVWAYQAEIGNDGLGMLIAPRGLILTAGEPRSWAGPVVGKPGRGGAAPGRIVPLDFANLQADYERIGEAYRRLDAPPGSLTAYPKNAGLEQTGGALGALLARLGVRNTLPLADTQPAPTDRRTDFDPSVRLRRQFDQLVAFSQKTWRDSEPVRAGRFAKVDVSSPEKYEASIRPIRTFFDEEVIGKLPDPDRPMNPKTRELYDTPKWRGYEVTLDLYPDVFAYGILLLPKDLKEGDKRPVVVCQHGLEGRPQDVCNPKERTRYYNSFAAQLADLGYIVYAPQNPYIGQDKFRVLQRKANPLKLSLFSFIVRQHERTLDWLCTLPNVDDQNLAFYGLSYGGKTAMRVPAILPRYCLSICAGDFNEWVGKNVSVDFRGSYMWTGEYEMPEFALGITFNYAEMAYLIAPRPFMVERGHDDGVGIDEMVAYEYAKVRYMYANRLKLPDRQAIEWFVGGHEINGKGTFAFLKQHTGWPK